MGRTVGIGVIGMGWMGCVHSHSYLQLRMRFPDLPATPRLLICADEVGARADEAHRRFGFERSTTDWREVIGDPSVEVVNIGAPNQMHLELVEAAAAAGKHVFCEKPVGCNPDETARIYRAAQRAGILTWVGYNYRWAPTVQHAVGLVQEGTLGQLTHYRGRFFAGYASNPDGVLSWRFDEAASGLGVLGDLFSHAADMAHMIAGPIARVVGNRHTFIAERPLPTPGEGTHFSIKKGGPKGAVTNEDYAGALLQFTNGVQGSIEVCRVIQGGACEMAFEVHGTRGAVRWNFERMNELQLYLAGDAPNDDAYTTVMSTPSMPFHANFNPGPAIGLGYDDLKVIEAHQFLQAIASGRQGEPGFAQALAVAEVQRAVQRSWTSDAWEEVAPID